MDLALLGLSQNEAKTYETLLRIGRSTASEISRESGVTYGRIYEILASLENKGLVHNIPGKTKTYVPSSPRELKDYLQEKRRALDETEQEILHYESLYKRLEKEPVVVATGRHNFKKITDLMREPKKFSYHIKYLFLQRAAWLQRARARKRKGVDIKIIGSIENATKKDLNAWKKIEPNIKPIQNSGFAMSIHDEEIMLSIKEGHTIVLIRDKACAQVLKQLFNAYYST